MGFIARKATKNDMTAISEMVQELADFEKMPDGPELTVADLCRDGGFDDSNSKPFFHCYVAEEINSSNEVPKGIVGYSLYFYTYSTYYGKSLFLEDLYVKPNYRKQGVGKLLFATVAKDAKDSNCLGMGLHALDWNPARGFYNKMGGKDVTVDERSEFFRFDREAIEAIANSG